MRPALESQAKPPAIGEIVRQAAALRVLTRTVWNPDCTLDAALAEICRTAAETLGVARVNVWRLDREGARLVCIHAYDHLQGRHAPEEALETLSLDAAYASQLDSVRVISYDDLGAGLASTPTSQAWRAYFKRHRILSLVDAPVLVEGELTGVICHEHVDEPREWTPGEKAFAGSMGDFVAMALEIFLRRKAVEEIHRLRLHDKTTDLPNRDFFHEALAQRLRLPRAVDQDVAVVHIKIGLPQGAPLPGQAGTMEDVMAQAAERLRALADEGMHLSRVRSDGFALVPGAGWTQREVIRLAERCAQISQAPIGQDAATGIETAVGVAFAPAGGTDARDLMRKAEQASEQALAGGGRSPQVYDAEHHGRLASRLAMESALWRAFEQEDFDVHFQPEVCLESGRWLAAEALLRWRRDDALVVAGEFIEVVESCGLVVPLGAWVLERACRTAATWRAVDGGDAPGLRVNLSNRQFESPGIVEMVAGCLQRCGFPANRLCLEITETTLMRDVAATTEVMVAFRALGISIAIDDFGTGYSSFAHLKRFPIDALKIDRSFVAGVPGDVVDSAIIGAICVLATKMGIDVVVEGVESPVQRDWLREQGLRKAQGFLFAPALANDELLARFG